MINDYDKRLKTMKLLTAMATIKTTKYVQHYHNPIFPPCKGTTILLYPSFLGR